MDILRSAFRQLRAHAGFSALIIALLAVGIGANTAIFGVVHAVLLKPLPFPSPGELVMVRKPPRDAAANIPGGGDLMPDSEFNAWIEAVPKSFRSLAAYRNNNANLQRGDGAVRVPSAAVTGEFFPLLGVSAWRGRLFTADDLKPGATPVTVLSHSAWASRFNSADDALGQVVRLDDTAHTIIGILPPAFEFVDPVQFWRPLVITATAPGEIRIQMVRVFGRLLSGTTHDTAARELDGLSERFWNNLTVGTFSGGPGGQREIRTGPRPTDGAPAPAGPGPAPASSLAAVEPVRETPGQLTAPDGRRMAIQLPPGADPNDPRIKQAIADAIAQQQANRRGASPQSGFAHAPESRVAPSNPAPSPDSVAGPRVVAGPPGAPGPSGATFVPAGPGGPRSGPPGALRLPFADSKAQLITLQEQLARQSRTTLWLLLGAVGFVLLIACANIANLQLARAASRKREAAVRAALGASPARLALELLLENLLLALAGGVLGVVLAWWGTQALEAFLASFLPRVNPIGVSLPVLGFAVLLAVASGLAFGLAPAWQAGRVDLLEALKDGSHQATAGGHRWRQGLVALEVALALVLAVNAGLLVKSIYQLYSTELGYRTEDVMTANLSLPRRYGAPEQQRDFADRWLDALRAIPGVKSAAIADSPPLSGFQQMVLSATIDSRGGRANASVNSTPPPAMGVASVTPEFFSAAGIALKQGRFFSGQDGADAPAVAIVNEAFLKVFHPNGFTLGSPVSLPTARGGHGAPASASIIGVVADIKPRGFDSAATPMAYFPFVQQPRPRLAAVLQFEGDAAALSRAVQQATHKVDTDLALDPPATLADQINRQNAPRRVTLMLTTAFAATAVLLAALGIFGVMSYTVTQRTQEIGVRMALGADAGMILRWMLRYGGIAVGVGLVAGLGLTFATSQLLTSQLSGITALDPAVVAVGMAGLALIGLAACVLPARRATRINPVEALRSE